MAMENEQLMSAMQAQFKQMNEWMSEQFKQVNEQFKQVNEQFKQVNEQFAQVNGRLDKIEARLDKVEQRLDKVEQRLDKVEAEVSALRERQIEHTKALKNHDRHLDALYGELWRVLEVVDTKQDKAAP